MPIPAPGSLPAEKAALAPGGRDRCRWERPWRDPPLKERPVPRGPPPARPSPAQTPDFRALYCNYGMPGGLRRGIFLGAVRFLRFASKRDSTAYSQKIFLSFLHFFRYAHKAGTPPAGGSRGRPFSGRCMQKIRTYRHNKRFALHIRKPDSRHGLPGFLIFDSVGLFICNI